MSFYFQTNDLLHQSTVQQLGPAATCSETSTESAVFNITRATSEHAKGLFDLINAAYKREITRKETVDRYSNQEGVSELIKDVVNVHWLVLESSSRVIGSLQILQKGDKYSLNAFAIDARYKGNNFGVNMLVEAEKCLTAKKVNTVFLSVISIARRPFNPTIERVDSRTQIEVEDDKLANFYISNGFKFTGLNTIPASSWIDLTCKPEYQNRVFFREMEKTFS